MERPHLVCARILVALASKHASPVRPPGPPLLVSPSRALVRGLRPTRVAEVAQIADSLLAQLAGEDASISNAHVCATLGHPRQSLPPVGAPPATGFEPVQSANFRAVFAMRCSLLTRSSRAISLALCFARTRALRAAFAMSTTTTSPSQCAGLRASALSMVG